MGEEPRAWTADEVRGMLLEHIKGMASYWATLPDKTPLERCDGLAFSVLGMLDGVSGDFPGLDLVLRPHPDDKSFLENEGRNWFEDGMVVNESDMLHEDPRLRR